MAIIAYPFDAQDITEAQYGALIGAGLQSGVVGTPASNHFKVVAGAGMGIIITAVGGNSLALLRGHACQITANENLTVPAASESVRADLVVLRMDYATNTIAPAIKPGTAGSTTPPAPTWAGTVFELPLAIINIPAGTASISSANIVDARLFVGATVGAWPQSQRPTGRPAIGYNLTTSQWEATLDGSTWATLARTSTTLAEFEGVLPVTKGGTGASTPQAAREALDIYVGPTAPAHKAGRIWIKLPS